MYVFFLCMFLVNYHINQWSTLHTVDLLLKNNKHLSVESFRHLVFFKLSTNVDFCVCI